MADSTLQPVQAPHRNWRNLAACRGMDPDLFFPERGDLYTAQAAQAVCGTCPVAADCLEFAIEVGEKIGVWGGLSGNDLRKEKRRRGGGRRGQLPQPIKHGTPSGYHAHRRRGQEACHACKTALAVHQQATRQSRKRAVA